MQAAQVLIVDDRLPQAEILALNLRLNGFRPCVALDASSASLEAEAGATELILLNASLGGASSLRLARDWNESASARMIPVIVMGHRSDDCSGFELLSNCAGVLRLPVSMPQLLRSLAAVGGRDLDREEPSSLCVGDLILEPGTHRVYFQGAAVNTRPVEFKLLHFLMAHPEEVHTRGQLVQRIWGRHAPVSERTVDAQIKRLRSALGPASGMLETVRRFGYRLTREPAARKAHGSAPLSAASGQPHPAQ